MTTLTRYPPLPPNSTNDKDKDMLAMYWTALWRRRRALHCSFLFVVALSVFLLFEYASFLFGAADEDGLPDSPDEPGAGGFDPALDSVYIPFQPPKHPSTPHRLKPSTPLPLACLDAHIAQGELCFNAAAPRLDVLWTWVNGSDILLVDAKARVEDELAETNDPNGPSKSWKQVRQFR